MYEAFEKIPSAEQVASGANAKVREALESFATRVAAALEDLQETRTTIAAQSGDSKLLSGIHGEKVRSALRSKGWEIRYESDQRDGDYLTISMSTGAQRQ